VLTWEQLDYLADVLLEMQARAKRMQSEHTIHIILNDKGYPRHCNQTLGGNFPKP
jgi:hypothetical protein